jgi:beta-glucanase (GH16 family)
MRNRSPASERRASPRRSGLALAAAILALGLAACLKTAAPAEAADGGPLAKAPDGRPLVVTFADEFTSFRPWREGRGVWRTVYKDGKHDDPFELRTLRGNKELQLYVDPDIPLKQPAGADAAALDPFSVKGGMLELTARPAPPALSRQLGDFRYFSGLISTQPVFAQTYGYFEMRAKLPRGKGLWPAFWMLPQDMSWPPELDVMESIGDPGVYWVTAHSSTGKTPESKHEIAPDAFHVFAVAWDPKELVWYVDGREVNRQPTPPDMHKPMYMVANLAVGGYWPGDPDGSTQFPARFTIDYIRAYRFAR